MITDKVMLSTYEFIPQGWWMDAKPYAYLQDGRTLYNVYVDNRFTQNYAGHSTLCQTQFYDADLTRALSNAAAWVAWCNECAVKRLPMTPPLTDDSTHAQLYRALLAVIYPPERRFDTWAIKSYSVGY